MRSVTIFLGMAVLGIPASVSGQEINNIWLMWERAGISDHACLGRGERNCPDLEEFRSHFLMQVPALAASELFQSLSASARKYGSADIRHERLPICLNDMEDVEAGPVTSEVATPVETLEGLEGVHADFRGLRGPAGYTGSFGAEAQEFMLQSFAEAGIRLLEKEELETTPGQPTLSIRYAPEVPGCKPWSISLSLTQNVVLSRDASKMISAVTWSASAGQDETDIEYGADDAMRTALGAFVEAWRTAHGTETELR